MSDTGVPSAAPFTVLFVCTGNICRSRIAEQVFRDRFGETAGGTAIRFASAGTHAMVGDAMPEQAQQVATLLGGHPDGHTSTQLVPDLVAQADLVIALTREHRSEIARMLPRASRYTFTLRESARLIESLVTDDLAEFPAATLPLPDRLRGYVPLLAMQRSLAVRPQNPDDDDVIDPYRRSQSVYDLTGQQIQDATDRIVSAVSVLRATGLR